MERLAEFSEDEDTYSLLELAKMHLVFELNLNKAQNASDLARPFI